MKPKFFTKLKGVLKGIYEVKDKLYYPKYIKQGFKDLKLLDRKLFESLPIVTDKDLVNISYKDRRIYEKTGLNKLTYFKSLDSYVLVHRTLDEIRNNKMKVGGDRPMVLMQDVYEALEYCLYFYEKGVLPLIGEVLNPAVVLATARQYKVNALYMDKISKDSFLKDLQKLKLPLKSITIIDNSLDSKELAEFRLLKAEFILNLFEFGAVAYLCPDQINMKNPVFHPFDDVWIESQPERRAILTSNRLQACPMIRYQSDIRLEKALSNCSCARESYLLT